MTLDELRAHGAELNAGYLDVYEAHPEGKHIRIADVAVSGEIVYTPEGEAWVARQTAKSELDAELDAAEAEDEAEAG